MRILVERLPTRIFRGEGIFGRGDKVFQFTRYISQFCINGSIASCRAVLFEGGRQGQMDLVCKGLPFQPRAHELGAEVSKPGLVVRVHVGSRRMAIILPVQDSVQEKGALQKRRALWSSESNLIALLWPKHTTDNSCGKDYQWCFGVRPYSLCSQWHRHISILGSPLYTKHWVASSTCCLIEA